MITTLLLQATLATQPAPTPAPPPAAAAATSTVLDGPTPERTGYPLGPLSVPDFLAPGDPFTLTDLRYRLSDPGETTDAFAARVRYRDWGYLGVESEGERRGLTLLTHRVTLGAFSTQGAWDLSADFFASRFTVSANAHRRGSVDNTWLLEPSASYRITPDLELSAWGVADTDQPSHRTDGGGQSRRTVTELGSEVFLQQGARFAVTAEFVRNYELIETRDENRRDTGSLWAVAQIGGGELSGRYSLEDVTGRFPRRVSDVNAEARVPLAAGWLLEGGARNRFDHGGEELVHEYRGALTWFGRRFTLPRAGRAAEHAVELARHATRVGEYQLGAFDPDALRLQRERLSLSPRREELREEMRELYRAQVEERSLPLLGLSFRDRSDSLTGETSYGAGLLLGIPWPPAWPWRAGEGSVRFLQLAYEHEWRTTATAMHSGADALSLTIALNREMDLVVSWSRAQATALDIVRGLSEHRRFEVSYVYARGR